MKIFAIDPGNKYSAFVLWNGTEVLQHDIISNEGLLNQIIPELFDVKYKLVFHAGIEMVASYGMPVGASIFETCVWIGRFQQRIHTINNLTRIDLIFRKDIKMKFCQSMRAKDSNIRQSLIDRFGIPGTKNNKGITYGLKADEWSAFAIAVYLFDNLQETK